MLSVTEHRGVRSLLLGTGTQTQIAITASGETMPFLFEEWTQSVAACAFAWLAAGDWHDFSPCALLLGGGGAVLARVLRLRIPVHIVEIEPEVLQVAQSHFDLVLNDTCTAEVLDAVAFVEREARQQARREELQTEQACNEHEHFGSPHAPVQRFSIAIVDCFTADGVASVVTDATSSLFRRLSEIIAPAGLLIVNLHAAHMPAHEPAHEPAERAVMSHIATHFACVYALASRSCRNVIALCHQGDKRCSDEWRAMLEAAWSDGVGTVCPDLSAERIVEQLECVFPP